MHHACMNVGNVFVDYYDNDVQGWQNDTFGRSLILVLF